MKSTTVIASLAVLLSETTALSSQITISSNGINSIATGQTGNGIRIGQVEEFRPGKRIAHGGFDDPAHSASQTRLTGVFIQDAEVTANEADMKIDQHAQLIAGIMVSSDRIRTGVAPDSLLYASATDSGDHPDIALSAQTIALQGGNDVRAINFSFGTTLAGNQLDGNSLLTKFVDWSARQDDVLYVVAGNEQAVNAPIPTDTYNGMTVAFSNRNVDGVYREVPSGVGGNDFTQDSVGPRTSTDIVAPGQSVEVLGPNDGLFTVSGTSAAAPHLTGTVALLQQFGEARILSAGAPRWDADFRRHEVMKSVLMNSADKIEDDGALAPIGSFLGMDRTLLDHNGDTWLDSEAFMDADGETPLDNELGTGHLNAKRALEQFANGEFDPDGADVPLVGWDFDTTTGPTDINKYAIDTQLDADTYFSATLSWDIRVNLSIDTAPENQYNIGDDFGAVDAGNFNWMFLYLVPAGSTSTDDAVAMSVTRSDTIQHIFAEIPTTDDYELWVEQVTEITDDPEVSQDYAVAWWGPGASVFSPGDFNGDGVTDGADLTQWRGDFNLNDDSDADGDGDSDGNDILIWQRNQGLTAPIAAVPEPAGWIVGAVGLALVVSRRTARYRVGCGAGDAV